MVTENKTNEYKLNAKFLMLAILNISKGKRKIERTLEVNTKKMKGRIDGIDVKKSKKLTL